MVPAENRERPRDAGRDAAKWEATPDAEPATLTEAHDRWMKKKRRLESPFSPPAWFQARIEEDGTTGWPIDKVVNWSKTDRGGKQYSFEIFAAPAADAGCMRWGICDTGTVQ